MPLPTIGPEVSNAEDADAAVEPMPVGFPVNAAIA